MPHNVPSDRKSETSAPTTDSIGQKSLSFASRKLLDTYIQKSSGQKREGQEQMLDLVSDALEQKENLLVQAGTGTGKSLAYIIPTLEYESKSADHTYGSETRPVVISTATIALQTQIIEKEIPQLLNILDSKLDRPLKVSLQKGRPNFLCKYKLAGGIDSEDSAKDTLENLGTADITELGEEILRIRQWAEVTETGDRDDLKPGVSQKAWDQVSTHPLDCLGHKCPMFDECFMEISRQQGAQADVIVTNHALLAHDIKDNSTALPEYGSVIIDEAHEFIDRVTSALTFELSAQIIIVAARNLKKYSAISTENIEAAADEFATAFQKIDTGLIKTNLNPEIVSALTKVYTLAKQALVDSSPKTGEKNEDDGNLSAVRNRMQEIVEVSDRFLAANLSSHAIWVHRNEQDDLDVLGPATVYIAPLEVGSYLESRLFGQHPAILTSATLSIDGKEEWLARGLGLDRPGSGGYSWQDVGSPFVYEKQGILYTAAHLEKPARGVSHEQLTELKELMDASQGGTLGLFSSKAAAETAANFIRQNTDHTVLLQGELTLSSLIEQFKEELNTSLFGTMSLWQGVDVPDLTSRLVVIDRIPFPRPDEPLSQARSNYANANGGNGFMAVSATQAAIKLAQGVGRLIRSTNDQGVVAILDSRLSTARYGNFLKSALPNFWQTTQKDHAQGALTRLGQKAQKLHN